MTIVLITQGIGLLALLANLSVFQTNKRKDMLLLGLAACLLWATHFYMLGAITATAMNLVAASRFYVYYKISPRKQNHWILYLFLAITALATVSTWDGLISLLPFVGTSSMVIAFWLKETKNVRRLALLSSPPWIIYAAIVGSYPSLIAESLLLGSNLIGQARFDFNSLARSKFTQTRVVPKT